MILLYAAKSVHFVQIKWARTVKSCNALKEIIVVIYRDSSSSYIIVGHTNMCKCACVCVCYIVWASVMTRTFHGAPLKCLHSMKSRSIYISIFIVCLTRCASLPLQITDPTTTFHWLCTTKYVLFEIADLFIWSILCEDLLAFFFLHLSYHFFSFFFFHRHFDCCRQQMNLLIIITRFPGSTMIIVHFITNEFCTSSLKYFLSVCGTKIKMEAMR